VGINDNFFALGGDSIKGIQIVARLQSLGFETNIGELFTHQTIAAFSSQLRRSETRTAEQGTVTGPLPLNPIQRWFFENYGHAPALFNQSVAIETTVLPPLEAFSAACRQLCSHHDALRARFHRKGGEWQAEIDANGEAAYRLVEYAWNEAPLDTPATVSLLRELQGGMDLARGPLLTVGLLRGRERHAIVFAVHHLVVDVISWNILLEDFQSCLAAAERGATATLPPKSDSFTAWNRALTAHARSGGLRKHLAYWSDLAQRETVAVCLREQSIGTVGNARAAILTIDPVRSGHLQREANRVYRTEPQHLLLCALKRALNEWRGHGDYLINLEGHGRDAFPGSPEPARTVGWFTVAFPFLLNPAGRFNDLASDLKATKEAVRAAQQHSLSYGLVRHLAELTDSERAMLSRLQPQIGFNYLGRVDTGGGDNGNKVTFLPRDVTTDPQAAQQLALDFVVSVKNARIEIEVLYDTARLTAADVETLLGRLDAQLHTVLQHCLAAEGSEFTASDFGSVELRQDELESIFEDLNLN